MDGHVLGGLSGWHGLLGLHCVFTVMRSLWWTLKEVASSVASAFLDGWMAR